MADKRTDANRTNEWFRPTRGRLWFAAALAISAFFIPQGVPLVWYPLNEPGNDILYLEITCASDQDGDVQIFYNLTQGINPLDSIFFPISPSKQTYTYTFPLPDAPITELRVGSVNNGGTLIIRRMRILDRRSKEMRRFTADMFRPLHEIESITPVADGWQIKSSPSASDPQTRIEMFSPIIAKDINYRNILRCLLSWSYLGMMLWILLMAVLFTFYRPCSWRDLGKHLGFYAVLALLFSMVGNRGLIRNSWHYAQYEPLPLASAYNLEFDLGSSSPSTTQLYWDLGKEFNESESSRMGYAPIPGLQTIRFPLPHKPIQALRYDPRDDPGSVSIRGIRVVDSGQRTRAIIPLESLKPTHQIAQLISGEKGLTIKTTPDGNDPNLVFSSGAIDLINQVIASVENEAE